MYDGTITIKADLDTKSFDAQIQSVESEIKSFQYELNHAKENKLTSVEVEEYSKKLELAKNKLVDLNRKKTELNKNQINNFDLESISNSTSTIIRKVKQWGLAIFSIRSAYTLIRHSVSRLTEYDSQLKADIDYINYALAMSLKPIIEFVISLVYKLLSLINDVAYAMFGVNLFSGATTNDFKATNKEAKELKNTLAGFDEMNILDSNKGSSGSGGSGLGTPSYDLSKIKSSVVSIKDLEKATKELKEENKVLNSVSKDSLNNTLELAKSYREIAQAEGLTEKQTQDYVDMLKREITTGANAIKSYEKMKYSGNVLADTYNILNGNNKMWTNSQKQELLQMKDVINEWGKAYEQGLLNEQQQREFVYTSVNVISALELQGEKVGKLKDNLVQLTGVPWDVNVKVAVKEGELQKLRDLAKGIANLAMNITTSTTGIAQKTMEDILRKNGIKYAKGGIINNPGAGVPLGGMNIGGEAGMEGVIPLTDSQQMAILGEAIGKYVNINLTSNTNLDGRTIARQVSKLQNSNSFATNR